MSKIGVAISGGGHRASLFGLGVLLYLADVGKNANVVSISSVSGGSLTNAYVGLQGDFTTTTKADFRKQATWVATYLAKRGTLFVPWWSKVYFALTAVGLLAALVVPWLLPWPTWAKLAAFVVALVLWYLLLGGRRGDVCAAAYAATVLESPGSKPTLGSLANRPIDHVICATHLNAGEHLYLAPKFVYSWRFGWGAYPDYPLQKAAQASTALPGAFPPRWLATRHVGFKDAPQPPDGTGTTPPKAIPLVDGGVYDNMADQWFKGIGRRRVPAGVTIQKPDEVVLVNASASKGLAKTATLRIPLVGELLGLMKDIGVMYDNSASLRKSGLIGRFDLAALGSTDDLRGALVDIGSNPYTAADWFAGGGAAEWPQRAARAPAAQQFLAGMTKQEWQVVVDESKGAPTNLSAFGVDLSAKILRHAYALAAANLHVLLDYPLPPALPPLADFRTMCGG